MNIVPRESRKHRAQAPTPSELGNYLGAILFPLQKVAAGQGLDRLVHLLDLVIRESRFLVRSGRSQGGSGQPPAAA